MPISQMNAMKCNAIISSLKNHKGNDKHKTKKPARDSQLLVSFAHTFGLDVDRCTAVVRVASLGPSRQSQVSRESQVVSIFHLNINATKQQAKTNNATSSRGYATCSKAPGKSTWWRVFAAKAFNSSNVFKFASSPGITNWCSLDHMVSTTTNQIKRERVAERGRERDDQNQNANQIVSPASLKNEARLRFVWMSRCIKTPLK